MPKHPAFPSLRYRKHWRRLPNQRSNLKIERGSAPPDDNPGAGAGADCPRCRRASRTSRSSSYPYSPPNSSQTGRRGLSPIISKTDSIAARRRAAGNKRLQPRPHPIRHPRRPVPARPRPDHQPSKPPRRRPLDHLRSPLETGRRPRSRRRHPPSQSRRQRGLLPSLQLRPRSPRRRRQHDRIRPNPPHRRLPHPLPLPRRPQTAQAGTGRRPGALAVKLKNGTRIGAAR